MTSIVEPFDIVIFDATRNLAMNKLLPALFLRHVAAETPEDMRIIGLSLSKHSTKKYRELVTKALQEHIPDEQLDNDSLNSFLIRIYYIPSDVTDPHGWAELIDMLGQFPNRIRFYCLTVSQSSFGIIAKGLFSAGLSDDQTRLIIEKPLGKLKDKGIETLLETISFNEAVPCIITGQTAGNNEFPILTIERLTLPIFSTISLKSKHIEPQFKADELASVMAKLIPNINSGAETLIGIFGNWGRGKTYLMDLIWKKGFDNAENDNRTFGQTEVVRVNFHAWKYQNTPAIWGFLYSLFLEKYLSENDSVKRNWFQKQFFQNWKIINLNIDRKGWGPIFWTFLALIIGIIWYLLLTFDAKWNLLSFLGLNGLLFLFFLYGRIPNAKKTIEDYTKKTNLLDYLGTQKLVQDELNTLLKRWIKEPETKKILLFIDDLDRCNIDKIIDVVDALRVILEDHEISNRLIIVIAIDQRILKLAIKEKYKSLNFDHGNDPLSSEKISHEYLDKLFLIGIKLGNISDTEKSSYINELTGNVYYDIYDQITSPTTKEIQEDNPLSLEATEDPDIIKDIQKIDLTEDSQENSYAKTSITLSLAEQQSLTEAAALIPDTTPRQLKILYFRFVLAKQLIKKSYDPYNRLHAVYLLGKIVNKTIVLRQENGSLPQTEDIKLVDLDRTGIYEFNDSDVDAAVEIVTTF